MESVSFPTGPSLITKQVASRRLNVPTQDLWAAVRSGNLHDVEMALTLLKKNNKGSIDARNCFGSTALHIAVWRNNVPIVRRLLSAGAHPDVRDGESGWSSLHRALYFGHLAVAGVLIAAGASMLLEDSKGRTPVDLLSGPVKEAIGVDTDNTSATEVFSWGNGANYQLGTGTAGIQKVPCRIDSLQDLKVTAIAAAKFHSVSVTATGDLYSWGFGRGGRLGHSEFDVHSGQVAVITPQLVSCGLGSRRVKAVAVGKHHTIAATRGGEVFTWGSNREGQLGYPSVDTQPIPRRVNSLKARVVAVAAANKHSAAISDVGDIFTWGCNTEGQLGYGTSNSASNYAPRAVESLKGKAFRVISASKYHTLALGVEGEVFTWGFKMVAPRRVSIARNTKKGGAVPLKFHRAEHLHITAIAAGTVHSTALSEDGLIFYWASADPHLRCRQLLSMAAYQAIAVNAAKYRTTVVTASGDVFLWDGDKTKEDSIPCPSRVHGIKRATHISIGENHFLAVTALSIPKFPSTAVPDVHCVKEKARDSEDSEEELILDDAGIFDSRSNCALEMEKPPAVIPSLKDLCQIVMAQHIVEPKNALQILEVADSLGASDLRKHCEDMVLRNLDYMLTVSPMAFANVRPALLADVEKTLDAQSSEPWCNHHLPTPTASFPAVIDSEDELESTTSHTRGILGFDSTAQTSDKFRVSKSLFTQGKELDQALIKQVRTLRRKLQQIEILEQKQAEGCSLDGQQMAKLQSKQQTEELLQVLESGVSSEESLGNLKSQIKLSKTFSGSVGIPEDSALQKMSNSKNHHSKGKKKKKSVEQPHVAGQSGSCIRDGVSSKGFFISEQVKAQTKSYDIYNASDKEKGECEHRKQHAATEGDKSISSVMDNSYSVMGSLTHAFQGNGNALSVVSSQNLVSELPQELKKRKSKKGGLSMFLSGALDAKPKIEVPTPPVPVKQEGPAWGGAKLKKVSSSLIDIQIQQKAESGHLDVPRDATQNGKGKQVHVKKHSAMQCQTKQPAVIADEQDVGSVRIPLSNFVRRSAPIPVTPVKAMKAVSSMNLEHSPPPWAGASPVASASSFKEIQLQQVKHKAQLKHSSPKLDSPIGALSLPLAISSNIDNSSSGTAGGENSNRWFKPDIEAPSPLRYIQMEEEAMKDLRCIYGNVKLVRREVCKP